MKSLNIKLPLTVVVIILAITLCTNFVSLFYQNQVIWAVGYSQLEAMLEGCEKQFVQLIDDSFGTLTEKNGQLVGENDNNIIDDYSKINSFAHDMNIVTGVYVKDSGRFIPVINSISETSQMNELPLEAENSLRSGKGYYEETELFSSPYYTYFTPIYDDMNRVIGAYTISVSTSEMAGVYDSGIQNTILITLSIIFIVVLLSAIYMYNVANSITKPVNDIQYALENAKNVKLKIDVSSLAGQEIQKLAQTFSEYYEENLQFNMCIDELTSAFKMISQGNLNIEFKQNYVGRLSKLKDCTEYLVYNLHTMIFDLRQKTSRLSAELSRISSGAQTLSQDSIKEFNKIESNFLSIGTKIKKMSETTKNLQDIKNHSTRISKEMQAGNEQMKNMIAQTSELNHKSFKMTEIVKALDEISAKTKAVSLNTKMEANKSEIDNKIFDKISEEIGHIASFITILSRSCSDIISNTSQNSDFEHENFNKATTFVVSISDMIYDMCSLVDKIASTSLEQTIFFEQTQKGISQIIGILKQNTDATQESAASAIELSQISDSLNARVSKFRLKQT